VYDIREANAQFCITEIAVSVEMHSLLIFVDEIFHDGKPAYSGQVFVHELLRGEHIRAQSDA
jgi:hypothetical protein